MHVILLLWRDSYFAYQLGGFPARNYLGFNVLVDLVRASRLLDSLKPSGNSVTFLLQKWHRDLYFL